MEAAGAGQTAAAEQRLIITEAADKEWLIWVTLPEMYTNVQFDFAMSNIKDNNPDYYFIDLDLKSRQLIGWGNETKDKVEVNLTHGFHRVFLTKGQYNKLEKQLKES